MSVPVRLHWQELVGCGSNAFGKHGHVILALYQTQCFLALSFKYWSSVLAQTDVTTDFNSVTNTFAGLPVYQWTFPSAHPANYTPVPSFVSDWQASDGIFTHGEF